MGTAVLAGSWLFGLGYYRPASVFVWVCLAVMGAILLHDVPVRWPPRRTGWVAAILLLPTVWTMPLPYKAVPCLLLVGLVLQFAAIPADWPRRFGRGCIVAAAILLVQSLAMEAYALLTARCHELPVLLSQTVGMISRLLGIETAVDGSWVVLQAGGQTHRIGATWDLLFDPASFCFIVGGAVLLGFQTRCSAGAGQRWEAWFTRLRRLVIVTLAWMPLRIALLLAILLQRLLRADAAGEPNVADVFVNAWIHLLLLAGPAFLAVRFLVRRPFEAVRTASEGRPTTGTLALAADSELGIAMDGNGGHPLTTTTGRTVAWLGIGIALLAFLLHWEPVGRPKSGRVMIVERHSTWEPTTEPYRTRVYGEAGSYNYAAAYEYCGQYFQMSRLLESDAIDDRTLAGCDVLVIKTPTARYSDDEVAAVERFVERGGSLLLIGDHTNVFNMNTYLNDVGRRFGFTFRNDLLFRVGTPYVQEYRPPFAAHPIVQHVPPMKFAVSCSIDPGRSVGRMVIRNAGMWSLPPAYQESNYHPQAQYRPQMHYGAWCQAWSAVYGRGRVLAFADSTLFSNFCTFQPGKAELLRGMLHWLNHRSMLDRRWVRLLLVLPLAAIGLCLAATGAWRGCRSDGGWIVLASAGLVGWTLATLATNAVHRWSLPVPPIQRPMTHVVIDRTVSDVPLFTGAFADEKEGLGYGMLEQWIPRVGNRISRETGAAVFQGNAIVIICPTRSVPRDFRQRLMRFVESGGRLLVFDSPDVVGSTANSILSPFGLTSDHSAVAQNAGPLQWATDREIPQLDLQAACSIRGGTPMARIGSTPVAAQVRFGKGLVTAAGIGSLFNDGMMGTHWLPEPQADTLKVYQVLYHLLRASLPAPTGSG
jgi:hypothetical protein